MKIIIPGIPIAKEIPNFDGYLACSNGDIYSIKTNRVLKQTKTKDGYLKVTLWKNGKGTTKKTHQFLALAWIANPHNKPQVNHINGNKEDNRIENLEWVTGKENMIHAIKTGLVSSEKAKEGYQTKLKKYGKKYLSRVASINASKADKRKVRQTMLERYGNEWIRNQALLASKVAEQVNYKKTIIIDIQTSQEHYFNSRKDAAKFINADQRRVTDSVRNGHRIKGRYIAKEASNNEDSNSGYSY